MLHELHEHLLEQHLVNELDEHDEHVLEQHEHDELVEHFVHHDQHVLEHDVEHVVDEYEQFEHLLRDPLPLRDDLVERVKLRVQRT